MPKCFVSSQTTPYTYLNLKNNKSITPRARNKKNGCYRSSDFGKIADRIKITRNWDMNCKDFFAST